MIDFLAGANALAALAVGLYFLRFWRESRDPLFRYFAVAFWLLGLQWMGAAATSPGYELRPWLYSLRLAAHCAILVGTVEKNRRRVTE
jgi:hypothetical protein